jgi:hypothetical protein
MYLDGVSQISQSVPIIPISVVKSSDGRTELGGRDPKMGLSFFATLQHPGLRGLHARV